MSETPNMGLNAAVGNSPTREANGSVLVNGANGQSAGSNVPGPTGIDTSIFSHMPFRKKKSPLRMGKRVYEFYNAPITKFWAHAVSYNCFIVPESYKN